MVRGGCCPRGDTPLDAVFFRLGVLFHHGRGVHASHEPPFDLGFIATHHLQGGCFRSTSFSICCTCKEIYRSRNNCSWWRRWFTSGEICKKGSVSRCICKKGSVSNYIAKVGRVVRREDDIKVKSSSQRPVSFFFLNEVVWLPASFCM